MVCPNELWSVTERVPGLEMFQPSLLARTQVTCVSILLLAKAWGDLDGGAS